ncbi:MAG: methyltransferase [Leptospiraceae bacterium]|nr:methyltransferase [Leptospiraceae bacterium]MDW7975284.1 methyltransferase [Leptospiraceae bacterium]
MKSEIQRKLLRIIQRPAKYKLHPNVIVPKTIDTISKEILFFIQESFHILELGCGWGEFAIEWLKKHPEHEYIAMEKKGDRIKKIIKKIEKNNIKNLKIIPVNFLWFYREILPENSFDLVIINFPDPWPKRRHWKHRLISEKFLIDTYNLLRHNGKIYIATDYGPYARKIISLFRKSKLYMPVLPWPNYTRKRFFSFPESKFEKLTLKENQPYYMMWRKV